jgi:hypothetical protein
MNDDALDALLARPLAEPVDYGFSSHMMAEIADIRLMRARREAVLSLLLLALVFAIAMLSPLGPVVTHAAVVIAGTPAVWFAGLMLALSGAVYGQVRT